MTLVQNTGMRKTLSAVKGSSRRKVNAIAALVDIEMFVKAANGRFFACTCCDPSRVSIGMVDEGIAGQGQLSFGGDCCHGYVYVVDLGPCKTSTWEVWE